MRWEPLEQSKMLQRGVNTLHKTGRKSGDGSRLRFFFFQGLKKKLEYLCRVWRTGNKQ